MKLSESIVWLTAAFVGFGGVVDGYAVVSNPSCKGQVICTSVVPTGNAEIETIDGEGNLECNFGQTEFDVGLGDGELCNVLCDEDRNATCTCVTESAAEKGLRDLSYGHYLYGGLGFVLFVFATLFTVYRVRKFNKTYDDFQRQVAEKGGMEKAGFLVEPQPPRICCYYLVIAVLFSVMVAFFAIGHGIRHADYWNGCGGENEFAFVEGVTPTNSPTVTPPP